MGGLALPHSPRRQTDFERYCDHVDVSTTALAKKPPQPMSSIAILLIPVGVVLGTMASLAAFYIDSEVGPNARYPLNVGGLLVSVFFGFFISLIVTAVGLIALVVASRVWAYRVLPSLLGIVLGCLIGGLAGSLVIRGGLDSWPEAVFEAEIVGISEAVLLGIVVAIRQTLVRDRMPGLR